MSKPSEVTAEKMLSVLGEMEKAYRKDLGNEEDHLYGANKENQAEIESVCDAIRTRIEESEGLRKILRAKNDAFLYVLANGPLFP